MKVNLLLQTHLVNQRLSLRLMAAELNIEVHRVNLTARREELTEAGSSLCIEDAVLLEE